MIKQSREMSDTDYTMVFLTFILVIANVVLAFSTLISVTVHYSSFLEIAKGNITMI